MKSKHLAPFAGLFLLMPISQPAVRADVVRAKAAGASVLPISNEGFASFNLGAESLEEASTGRVPNYIRAIAGTCPEAATPMAHLFKTVLYGGTIDAETKAAMGLLIAKENGSPYLVAHLTRILKSTDKGKTLLTGAKPTAKDRIAQKYALDLTHAVHGVSDSEFAQARAEFNDSQLVELTAVTCFYNYLSRFCQGANLPLEPWASEAPSALPKDVDHDDAARVTLASDEEMETGSKLKTPSPDLKAGLGIGIANSQRAMMRVSDIGNAWWDYMKATRNGAKLNRTMQLHISFAVSMVNGCRYCTVHQVVGLRKQGVDIEKLTAMKKDDSQLTPAELTVVTYARKLTKSPGTISGNDFSTLRAGLANDREAFDALLQTCTFSFMNRFTDGLRLPSEDEAVKTYQEVYGDGSYKAYPMTAKKN